MTFEEAALTRLRRYRGEADASLENIRGAEERARRLSARLFDGFQYTASLALRAGFEVEVSRREDTVSIQISVGSGESAGAEFAFVRGAAAETDEDLMHEELSRYSLEPSGYSGRILGWTPEAGEEPCQIFAVYRDGTWRTKGLFVAKARGKVEDPDEILNGFCLRIIGRIVDLAALTGGAGRRWSESGYTRRDFEDGLAHPTEPKFPSP